MDADRELGLLAGGIQDGHAGGGACGETVAVVREDLSCNVVAIDPGAAKTRGLIVGNHAGAFTQTQLDEDVSPVGDHRPVRCRADSGEHAERFLFSEARQRTGRENLRHDNKWH